MVKFINQERTQITNGTTSGPVDAMIAQGHVTQAEVNNAEPWRTLDEWKAALIGEVKALRSQAETVGIQYVHSDTKTYHVKCRDKDANALDVLDRKAEKENYLHSTWFLNSPTTGIELKVKADYDELGRQMHDHWQKCFNAYGQTIQGHIMLLATINDAEAFDTEGTYNAYLGI